MESPSTLKLNRKYMASVAHHVGMVPLPPPLDPDIDWRLMLRPEVRERLEALCESKRARVMEQQ